MSDKFLNIKDKEMLYYKVFNAVLKLELTKGHLLWKLSDVAKSASVTRSLIYYYFGKEKETVLREAWKFMIDVLFLPEPQIYDQNRPKDLSIKERMEFVIKKIEEMPYLFILFFFEKNKDSELGKMIRDAEDKLLDHLQKEFPTMTKTEILKIYLLELGAVMYQRLTSQEFDAIFGQQSY